MIDSALRSVSSFSSMLVMTCGVRISGVSVLVPVLPVLRMRSPLTTISSLRVCVSSSVGPASRTVVNTDAAARSAASTGIPTLPRAVPNSIPPINRPRITSSTFDIDNDSQSPLKTVYTHRKEK